MRTLALAATLLAAVPWVGMESAHARMGGFGGGHGSSGSYSHSRGGEAAAASRNRYTPSHSGSANRTSLRTWRWKTQPPHYGAASVAPPPSRGGDYPPRHPPPRWLHPPIISSPIPVTGGTVVNLPPPPPSPPVNGPPPAQGGPSGGGGAPPSGVAAVNDQRFVPDEILVRFNAGVSPAVIANFAQTQRLAPLGPPHQLPLINTALYHFRITDQRTVPAVLGGMQGDTRLAAAQPNYLYALRESAPPDAGAPSRDAARPSQDAAAPPPAAPAPPQAAPSSQQYAASKLHLTQAHALARGNGVLVVLIDSAVEATHPELRGAITLGFDAVKGTFRAHEHGTAMASAIIAHGRLIGVAPAARIVAVRAFDPGSTGAQATTVRLLDSLQWAATSSARVVNMSFTGPSDPQLHAMIVAARQKGLVLVAAAGNDGPRAPPEYPAAYPEVIAVTATDVDDHSLKVANRGSYVAVAAPGVEIFVASPNGGYDFTTGTSVAAAHVSGLVALLLERNPKLTPDAIQAILMQTAKDLGPKGRDDEFGAGLVDAYEALLTQTSEVAQQPATR